MKEMEPDLFALRNNDDGTKDFVVVGYDPIEKLFSKKRN